MAAHMFSSFSSVFTCVSCILQVFHLFWTYVASVLSRYCKSRSVLHICYNGTYLSHPYVAAARVPPSERRRSCVHMLGKRKGHEWSPCRVGRHGRRLGGMGPHERVKQTIGAGTV
jgi:hypothetical protein